MNPFKNISIFRNQSNPDLKTTEFPEKKEYLGNPDYAKSQLSEILLLEKKEEQLQQENDRLQHLTTVLIDHIWKSGERGLPLKEIDKQMKIFDDGGMDGIQRNK